MKESIIAANKKRPKRVENYLLLQECSTDSIGKNSRALEMEEDKAVGHKLLTELHPFLFKTPEEWNRASVMCERLKSTNLPNLLAPEKIIKTDDHSYFLFPYLRGKTISQVVEEAALRKKPIPFDMAFSIAIAIASLIEVGSGIIIKGQNVFHGFLTPDHIFIDYEGNIYLKYFGLWPLLDENEEAVSEMIRQYGAWLTPEFIRREKIVPKSDFYHLGYIVYRMLTGHYFSYLPGEDFETTFTSISFTSELPSTKIDFLMTFIQFFKKTLNPDVNKRFANLKEFKNHISQYAHIHEMDTFRSTLADYMQTLYSPLKEEEDIILAEELIPTHPSTGTGKISEFDEDAELIEIPVSPGKTRHSKQFIMTLSTIAAIIILIAGYFFITQLNKASKEKEIASKLMEEQDKKLSQVEQKLKSLEEKNKTDTSTSQEIKKEQPKNDTKPTISKQTQPKLKDQNKTGPDKTNKDQPPTKKTDDKEDQSITKPLTPPSSSQFQHKGSIKPTDVPALSSNPKESSKKDSSPTIPLEEVTVKPQQIYGKEPEFSESQQKTYAGRRANIRINLLIDENGNVAAVDILDKSKIPDDVHTVIIDTLFKWKYTPAKKNNNTVKVLWPIKLKIQFKYDQ